MEGVDDRRRQVLIVGAGVAGLECARVLAGRGHRVRVLERHHRAGGAVVAASVGPGREHLAQLAEWLLAECNALGAVVETEVEATPADLDAARADGAEVVLATGSRPNPAAVPVDGPCPVLDPLVLLSAGSDVLPRGPVVVHDPVGGPIGVGVAEWLAGAGFEVALVTPDQIAGTMLSADRRPGRRQHPAAAGRRPQGSPGPAAGRPWRSGAARGCVDRRAARGGSARRWSTAAIGCPRSPSICLDPGPCAPATAWRLAVSWRQCWKADGLAMQVAGVTGAEPTPAAAVGEHGTRPAGQDGCPARWR